MNHKQKDLIKAIIGWAIVAAVALFTLGTS